MQKICFCELMNQLNINSMTVLMNNFFKIREFIWSQKFLSQRKVFNTVIFPIKVSFLCCHDLRQFLNFCSLGNRFFKIVSFSLFVNVMPNVDASFDVHWKLIYVLRWMLYAYNYLLLAQCTYICLILVLIRFQTGSVILSSC